MPAEFKVTIAISVYSVAAAVVSGLFYYWGLPIFSSVMLVWFFVTSVICAAIALATVIVRAIWLGNS